MFLQHVTKTIDTEIEGRRAETQLAACAGLDVDKGRDSRSVVSETNTRSREFLELKRICKKSNEEVREIQQRSSFVLALKKRLEVGKAASCAAYCLQLTLAHVRRRTASGILHQVWQLPIRT